MESQDQVGKRRERPLGGTQRSVLFALHGHKEWYFQCGWKLKSHQFTRQILDTLVRRGLVIKIKMEKQGRERAVYLPAGESPA